MGRQMAFQLGPVDILKRMAVILAHGPGEEKQTVGQLVQAMTADEKERDKLRAVYVLMDKCDGDAGKALRCNKLVCWRRPDPGKFDIEMTFSRQDPPAWIIKEAGLFNVLNEKLGS